MLYTAVKMLSMSAQAQVQTCSTLRDAFQDNACCSATMGRQLDQPLHATTPATIAGAPQVFNTYKYMSANFTKMVATSDMANFHPIGSHTA